MALLLVFPSTLADDFAPNVLDYWKRIFKKEAAVLRWAASIPRPNTRHDTAEVLNYREL
jgi:hypothetical protein